VTGPGGSSQSQTVTDLNGRWVPLESAEETVLSDGPEGRVVERLVKKFDSQGRQSLGGHQLRGRTANRDGVGALIAWSTGGRRYSRLKTSGGSYLSSHDSRDILGLGPSPCCDWVEVRWPKPSMRVERFASVPSGRYTTLEEGGGETVR
jgi:hypothetical protein